MKPDPADYTEASGPGHRGLYVIQKHLASRLHYDLRLEMDGVLKSWAVPKQPPLEKGVKRLAVEVEDHALEYADFEGVIEAGYGAGTVEMWDRGEFELGERGADKLVVEIRGEKLKGGYVLIRLKRSKTGKDWLFFKR